MSTFQAIVYGIVQGFTEFLPVSSSAHHHLIPYLTHWPEPTGAIAGALALGSFLALLIYFRHDWASILSSFLQVVIFRKKPMTLDERLPFFLALSTVPVVLAWLYLREPVTAALAQLGDQGPLAIAGSLILFSIPLGFCESFSRKNKGMFDWTWLDTLLIGLGQVLTFVPGAGRAMGSLSMGLLRNFNRESTAKYSFFAAAPILGASAFFHLREVSFHAASAMPETSWLTFAITIIVSLVCSLLAIGGLFKQLQNRGFGQYITYRVVLGIGVGVTFWVRSRG